LFDQWQWLDPSIHEDEWARHVYGYSSDPMMHAVPNIKRIFALDARQYQEMIVLDTAPYPDSDANFMYVLRRNGLSTEHNFPSPPAGDICSTEAAEQWKQDAVKWLRHCYWLINFMKYPWLGTVNQPLNANGGAVPGANCLGDLTTSSFSDIGGGFIETGFSSFCCENTAQQQCGIALPENCPPDWDEMTPYEQAIYCNAEYEEAAQDDTCDPEYYCDPCAPIPEDVGWTETTEGDYAGGCAAYTSNIVTDNSYCIGPGLRRVGSYGFSSAVYIPYGVAPSTSSEESEPSDDVNGNIVAFAIRSVPQEVLGTWEWKCYTKTLLSILEITEESYPDEVWVPKQVCCMLNAGSSSQELIKQSQGLTIEGSAPLVYPCLKQLGMPTDEGCYTTRPRAFCEAYPLVYKRLTYDYQAEIFTVPEPATDEYYVWCNLPEDIPADESSSESSSSSSSEISDSSISESSQSMSSSGDEKSSSSMISSISESSQSS
jgi:hypothetical protein